MVNPSETELQTYFAQARRSVLDELLRTRSLGRQGDTRAYDVSLFWRDLFYNYMDPYNEDDPNPTYNLSYNQMIMILDLKFVELAKELTDDTVVAKLRDFYTPGAVAEEIQEFRLVERGLMERREEDKREILFLLKQRKRLIKQLANAKSELALVTDDLETLDSLQRARSMAKATIRSFRRYEGGSSLPQSANAVHLLSQVLEELDSPSGDERALLREIMNNDFMKLARRFEFESPELVAHLITVHGPKLDAELRDEIASVNDELSELDEKHFDIRYLQEVLDEAPDAENRRRILDNHIMAMEAKRAGFYDPYLPTRARMPSIVDQVFARHGL
jgi:hypothetical protein